MTLPPRHNNPAFGATSPQRPSHTSRHSTPSLSEAFDNLKTLLQASATQRFKVSTLSRQTESLRHYVVALREARVQPHVGVK